MACFLRYFLKVLLLSSVHETAGQLNGYLKLRRNSGWKKRLGLFNEVISSLVQDKFIVLHIDANISVDARKEIFSLPALRQTSHISVTLGSRQSMGSLGDFGLHIALFLTHQLDNFKYICSHWQPESFMLYSLMSADKGSLLTQISLNCVNKLVLVTQEEQEPPRLYSLLPFSTPSIKFLGYWNVYQFKYWDELFPNRFASFEGYTFHLATILTEPILFKKSKTGKPEGVVVNMLEAASSKLNFTYTLTDNSLDNKWGALENGTWSGLLGMVARGEKNFTVNGLFQSLDRMTAFSATPFWFEDAYVAGVRAPQPLTKWTHIYRPFSSSVWWSLAACLVIAVLYSLLQGYFMGRSWPGGVPRACLDLAGAMVGQSVPSLPVGTAGCIKPFLAQWFFYCLVVSAAFTSNLIALLTSPTNPHRIQTLHQLAQSSFRLALMDFGGVLDEAFVIPDDPTTIALREKVDYVKTLEKGEAVLLDGTHAFIETSTYLRSLLGPKYKSDSWYTVQEPLFTLRASWYFPHHTPWQHTFDTTITHLVAGGLVQHWYQEELRKLIRVDSRAEAERSIVPLSIQHLEGAFYCLLFGWIVTLIVLIVELVHQRISSYYYRDYANDKSEHQLEQSEAESNMAPTN